MSLYTDLIAAGIEVSSHYSDLYCPNTPEARALVRKHGHSLSLFQNQITHTMWIDVPFAFDPYWERQLRRTEQ